MQATIDEYSSTLEFFSFEICSYFYFGQLRLYLLICLRICEIF